jgi:hypothetical protein
MNIKKLMTISISAAAMFGLSGCGGGGDSTTVSADSTEVLTGTVADGYLVGAKVCLDRNFNGACDNDEPSAITDGSGRFTFTITDSGDLKVPLIVEAGADTVDLDDGQAIGEAWYFKASPGSTFISPLTTLVERELEIDGTLTRAQAMANLKSDLGLTIGIDEDYIAVNDQTAHNAAKIVAHSLAEAEANLTNAATAPNVEGWLIRLLAAKQIRAQADAIKTHALANDPQFLCDVNTTDVDNQLQQLQDQIEGAMDSELKAALLFMYQEEKMARDVYHTLGVLYPDASTFANIQLSEQKHMDAVEQLCIKYGVDISGVDENAVGEFVLNDLQDLYDTLVAQGSVSLIEGLKVGIAIEEKDITDITSYEEGMPSDVITVFENLREGSINHLAAFEKAYTAALK